MRILLSTYGSRGDVQPLAALAVALQAIGAEAVVCAPPDAEFASLLVRAGFNLVPAFSSVRDWVSKAIADPSTVDLPKRAAEICAAQYEAIDAAAEGCDVILAAGLFPSTAAARAVAEKRGMRYVYATFCPLWLPSTHHQPHSYRGYPLAEDAPDNRALWVDNSVTMQTIFGVGINAHRVSIGLEPVENVRDHVFTSHPWLASDPVLSPWAPTELCNVTQTGAWLLPDDRPLPDDVEAFLDAGPPPVYVGFGSMPMSGAKHAARDAIDAIRTQGRRALLLQGWADLAAIDDRDDCFVIGEVNQQALFRRVAAVVHHGGAGTTTAAARAGAPQLIVPQIGDQPYWARRVAELGIGVAHDGPIPTAESLSASLATVLAPETRERATAIGATIHSGGAMIAAAMLVAGIH